jgi:DNA polymerase-3 subunit beta
VRKSFSVRGGEFADAVHYTARWLVTKPIIPTHGGLLFEVDGDRLNIFGFNEDVTARATVEIDATEEPEGSFVVAGRLIDQLVATFPDRPIVFEQVGTTIVVSAGRFRATLPTMSEKDYPALPGAATLAGHVDGSAMADALHRVGTAASRDLTKQQELCGIRVDFDPDPIGGDETDEPIIYTLTMQATDSIRAARQSIAWEPADGDEDDTTGPLGHAFLALGATLVDAAEAFANHPEVALGWEDGTVSLTTPTRSLVVRTLDVNKFPHLDAIFEAKTEVSARIRIKDLTMPLKRADLLKNRETNAVRLDFTAGMVTIAAGLDSDTGGDEEADVEYNGPETSIWFRSDVLHSALASAPGEFVDLAFTTGMVVKPAIVTSPTDETWRLIMVPLRPSKPTK